MELSILLISTALLAFGSVALSGAVLIWVCPGVAISGEGQATLLYLAADGFCRIGINNVPAVQLAVLRLRKIIIQLLKMLIDIRPGAMRHDINYLQSDKFAVYALCSSALLVHFGRWLLG